MWIKHNGELYNLSKCDNIYKETDLEIILSYPNVDCTLEFESQEIRDNYFVAIERQVFNLGNSYD